MVEEISPARAVPPGRILKRELEARGWTQQDLADILQRPPQAITEIVAGTKRITPETALELERALGLPAQFWVNLEANYRLQIATAKGYDDQIGLRSELYRLLPIRDLVRRGWVKGDKVLEEVGSLLGIDSLAEWPAVAANFRLSSGKRPNNLAIVAWAKRVEHLVSGQRVGHFSAEGLRKNIPSLLAQTVDLEAVRRVPAALADLGIRFALVPHLPQTYMDGAAFYVGNSPVIALSLRYDRVDSFWFTLCHELAHISLGHRAAYVCNSEDASPSHAEMEANDRARDWIINPDAWRGFTQTHRAHFSKQTILAVARSIDRHPGLVLGRLQHDRLVPYQHLRQLLPKVSPYLDGLIDRALT